MTRRLALILSGGALALLALILFAPRHASSPRGTTLALETAGPAQHDATALRRVAPPVPTTRASTDAAPDGATKVASSVAVTPLARFSAWAEKFVAAAPAGRVALLTEGETLAAARREFLGELIKNDPAAALAAAVPMRVREALPENIKALLEERVSGRGFFGTLIADNFETGVREVRREVVLNQKTYDAHVYGRRAEQATRRKVVFWGIAVGRDLAVASDPIRRIEPGEFVGQGDGALCPVSSRSAEIYGKAVAAEVGGRMEFFCGARHLELLDQRLAADSGSGGAEGDPPIAQDSWSQGPKTCLLMRVAFPDDPTEPITEDGAYAMMDGVNQWFTENSYDTTSIIPTVTPLLMLPQTKAWYGVQGTGTLLSDARDAAREAGFDTDNYHWDIVRHGSVPGFNWGGLGYVHGKGTWLQSSSVGVAVHELGHNYGLWHANYWTANGDSTIGPGANAEYGNSYDTMGAASAGNNQFNAAFKNQLDWLADTFVQNVTTSGVYRLHTFDIPNLTSGQKYALKVKKDYDRNYWAEFRQKFTGNRWFQNGIILNWDPWNNGVGSSAGGTHLLDTTPGTGPGKDDGGVIIGRTFSDWSAGVHFTPIARGNGSPENWIDVVVNLGAFPTNTPPVASFSADHTSTPTTVAINFTADATDADGDALAYWWDFGDDTFGANSPSVTKSWNTTGEYTVRLTVSDMKGGLYVQKLVITVGSPTTFRLAGRVLTADIPLEGVRVHNGLSGASYRGTYTDSDGYYALVNIAAGSNALSAVKYGYTFTRAGWTNSVVVGPSLADLNWNAVAAPVVSVAATDANSSELGPDPGTFTISRTGPTNVALAVKLNRTGSAFITSDYSMNPAPSNSPLQIVLPAGAAYVNILLMPVADAVSEGPETVTLTLIEDAAYVLGSFAEATITIADDDPYAKPTVAVSSGNPSTADNIATESGSDTGVFTFTRSGGSVANELVIYYSVGGTATAGADYAPLAGVVTIPAGETVTALPFTAIDDLEVETNETLIATILNDPTYNGAGGSATIVIVDNDPATVTITATDEVAKEIGGNTGTFTVTRVGNLHANLLVNYALNGTASNTADYSTLSGSVTLLAGRATATITVTPVNDGLLENEESIIATLLTTPAYNVGLPGSATITLIDDEIPSVILNLSDSTAMEQGLDPGAITFNRSGGTTNALTVYFTVNGTAISGADFQPPGNSIIIPAGTNAAVLFVTPVDDSFYEADETIRITLLPNPAYSLGTTTPQTVTIKDNDGGLPGVGFTFAGSSGPESDTFPRLSVSLSSNSASTVTVQYSVTGGTATGGGTDYTLAGGTLSLAAGVVNASVNISVNNDALVEANETIVVTLSTPSGAVLDAITTHTYTIIDDDASGTITITAPDAIASESGDTGTFRIARSGGTNLAQLVNFEVVGTASSPSDYLPIGTSAVIPAGASFVNIVIMPEDDTTDETNEAVVVNLQPTPGTKIGSPDFATVTILDHDDNSILPIVTITAPDAMASEPGADTGVFTIARDRGTNAPLTVSFTIGGTATSGTDYSNLVTSVTIPAGAYETNLVLNARDDATFETNETVVLTLTQLSAYRVGDPASATVTIVDNEIGVSVASSGVSSEDGSHTGQFVLTRTGSTVSNLAVNFLVGGTASSTDFNSIGTFAVIPAGTNMVSVPVVASDDALPESNETVVMTLASGAGYTLVAPTNATVVILDDEPVVSITASDATAYEAGDPGAFTITRTGGTNAPLTVFFTVGGPASSGVDFAAISNAAVIPEGAASMNVAVTPLNDAFTEGNETVQITLATNAAYAILAPTSASVTIVDDEINLLPVVAITSPTVETVFLVNTNSALVLEATAMDDGQPNPPGALATTWSRLSGPAPVLFANSNSAHTLVRFTASGAYVLRLAANDGQLTATDDLTVIVASVIGQPTNFAPIVSAGPNQLVRFGDPVTMNGSSSDDGQPNPPGHTLNLWSKVSGPGTVQFTNDQMENTPVTFSAPGLYVLRLTSDDGQVKTAGEVTLNIFPMPVVNLQATLTNASEFGPSPGAFVVTRGSDLSQALTVYLGLAGTASNGVDYAVLTNVLTLAPGIASATLVVTPLADGLPEGNESVVFSLLADTNYLVGSNGAAAMTIQDLPWDAWRFAHFSSAELQNTNLTGELGDGEWDGMVNLFEYAFNRDPHTSDNTNYFSGAFEAAQGPVGGGTSYVVTFKRRKSPTDLIYDVQVTSDLVTWQSGTNVARQIKTTDDGNGVTETVKFQIFGAAPRFVRLLVSRGNGGGIGTTR